MGKPLQQYYIKNEDGKGLHYICGSLFWRRPTTIEAITNFTPFRTKKDAMQFIAERLHPECTGLTVGRIQFVIS